MNENAPRYVPPPEDVGPIVLGLRETAVVQGLGGLEAEGRALLDTGNGGATMMSREFAESLSLVNEDGFPRMIRNPQMAEANGVVEDAVDQCVVVPAVTFSFLGIEITSSVHVPMRPPARTGSIWQTMDLLVSMNDIQKLERCGMGSRRSELEAIKLRSPRKMMTGCG